MEININSPSYYKNIYGVDDEIYSMYRRISLFVKNNKYSEIVNVIGITPIVAPQDLIDRGEWQEEVKYDLKFQLVSVRKHIDYDKYISSDIEGKKKLILDNILKSIKKISKKAKLDYGAFERDILGHLGYSIEEIKLI
ncbi:Imm44 family immunity protein [Clostridium cellulovorans]|uniref:Uncharacterized protein n=1 Tax=Clostridium cellulovorans (strain ATCC 35296 / DSM 3052 / OCM 3 / 743B) TaxID=573061 RepID=D9SWJ1_CLOC7|nr:Imm44 family immunity protein [Clostridium cellulovorans]ADL53273.1 hypothetical protein Clocel_3599 [Clostridium cellulovorans 743B]